MRLDDDLTDTELLNEFKSILMRHPGPLTQDELQEIFFINEEFKRRAVADAETDTMRDS